MDKATSRLLKGKRRKGLSYYPFGVEFALPTGDTITKLRFTGAFDRRKLRRMLNKALEVNLTVEQRDYLIDNHMTKLRPVTKTEFNDMLTQLEDNDATS